MSLEDLSPADKQKLNLGSLVATMMNDPNLSRETKRLLKKAKPELSFPELDTEEQIAQVREDSKKEADSLRQLLARKEAQEALQAEEGKIREAGLDPKVVRTFMAEKGIIDVDVVIELFQSRAQLAEPSGDQVTSPFQISGATKEELSAMWDNPSVWRQEKAAEIINKEFRGSRHTRG